MTTTPHRRNILTELTTLDAGGTVLPNSSLPLTPPSPDESLIQLRGLQRKSATYNYNAPDPVFFKTPTKSPKKTSLAERLLMPTRSSPRKKLNLSPEKKATDNTIMKRRLRLQNMDHSMNSEKHFKALNQAQLVNLLTDVLRVSPNIKETMISLMPSPDLGPIEARLNALQHNVIKCFPRNIWGNQDGSFSFLRVRAHLDAFKKECVDYGRLLMESQHWPTLFEYIIIALKLTLSLPNWPTSTYNKNKSSCIKFLATTCINAFKKSNIDETSLNEIVEKLEGLGDDPDVKTCIAYAKDLLKKD